MKRAQNSKDTIVLETKEGGGRGWNEPETLHDASVLPLAVASIM